MSKFKYWTCCALLSIYLMPGCSVSPSKIKEVSAELTTLEDMNDIMDKCQWIIDKGIKDTSLIVPLLTHIIDGRETSRLGRQGKSPYQLRVKALELVTGSKPAFNVSWHVDALVVDYYLDWAIRNKLIKTKDDIDVFHPTERLDVSSEEAISFVTNHDKVNWLQKYKWEKPPMRGTFHSKADKK